MSSKNHLINHPKKSPFYRWHIISWEIGLKPFSVHTVSILTPFLKINLGYVLHLDKNVIFTKITKVTKKIFEIQNLFFPWKPPWTKLSWLPTWFWSHQNYSFQAKIRYEKIQISEMGKSPKNFSFRSSTAQSDFWPKPMYLRTLWGVAIMMSSMSVLNLSDPIPTTGPFCGNSPVKKL